METGKLENLAFINRVVGLINLATRWQNSTLHLKVGDWRGSRKKKKRKENFSFAFFALGKQL